MALKLIEIYNQSYKPRLFIAESEEVAIEIASATGHSRRGRPRRLEDRTNDYAKDIPNPEKIQEFIDAGKRGSLRLERSNGSWIFTVY